MKNKLLLFLTTILLAITTFTSNVFADDYPTTLTITKSDGSPATQGTDYDWEFAQYTEAGYNQYKLKILKNNLTVSGTDTSNDIFISFDDDAEVLTLTINNLNLKGKGCGIMNEHEKDIELIVLGDNSIKHDDVFVSTAYPIPIASMQGLTISGTGNLTVVEKNPAFGIDAATDLTINMSGTLTLTTNTESLVSFNNINISNNITKIIARCDGEFNSNPILFLTSLNLGDDLQILGSTNKDAAEASMTEAVVDTDNVIKVDGNAAYGILITHKGSPTPGGGGGSGESSGGSSSDSSSSDHIIPNTGVSKNTFN